MRFRPAGRARSSSLPCERDDWRGRINVYQPCSEQTCSNLCVATYKHISLIDALHKSSYNSSPPAVCGTHGFRQMYKSAIELPRCNLRFLVRSNLFIMDNPKNMHDPTTTRDRIIGTRSPQAGNSRRTARRLMCAPHMW